MKTLRRFSFLIALLLGAPVVFAQQPQAGVTIVLKDGRSVTTGNLRRSGGNVMTTVQVGTGTGEIGYGVNTIARIEFPEPPGIKQARDFLAQGKEGEALAALRPVMIGQEPFRDVPGNWWTQAAQLQINALLRAGRESEAETLINELAKAATDPETANMARVQQAAIWTRKGQHDKALAVYDAVIKESKNRDALALAWLNKGNSLLALRKWEPAILAYLQVPVFYADKKLLVPQALLGGAWGMEGLQDFAGAEAKLNELIEDFPTSPEATTAKTEIVNVKKKQ